ncbi:MAG: hypothetical protein U0R27_07400 [Candidatus Nanopelagicales bacterium]
MTGAPTMEEPWPLRVMLKHFQDWVGRLGQAWVAGEISKIQCAGDPRGRCEEAGYLLRRAKVQLR